MLKKLKKILKKGAMSVEYIVIGVCVIGMAALATTFVSNKMSVAMGKENNSGDTNNGENTGDNNGTNSNLSSICNDNKTFFETYGIYPGKYEISVIDNAFVYKSEINANGTCIFEMYQYNDYIQSMYKSADCSVDLKSNEYVHYSYTAAGSKGNPITGVFSKFDFFYSDKDLSKKVFVYFRTSTMEPEDEDSYFATYLPKEAFKLGGHEDCTGFRTEKQDFITLNGMEYGEFTLNNDENQKLNISENRIEYINSTSNTHLIYDFANETIYDVNTKSTQGIIAASFPTFFPSSGVYELYIENCYNRQEESFPFYATRIKKLHDKYTIKFTKHA